VSPGQSRNRHFGTLLTSLSSRLDHHRAHGKAFRLHQVGLTGPRNGWPCNVAFRQDGIAAVGTNLSPAAMVAARFELEGLALADRQIDAGFAGDRGFQRHDDQLEDAVGQRLAASGRLYADAAPQTSTKRLQLEARTVLLLLSAGTSLSVIPISPNTPEGAS
jgi:hypothetical protein